jgi:hypothetical protein
MPEKQTKTTRKGVKGAWKKAKWIAWDHECRIRDLIMNRGGWYVLRLDRSGAGFSTRRSFGPCDVVARYGHRTLFIEAKRSSKRGGKSITLKLKDLEDVGKVFEASAPWGRGVKILVFAGTARVTREGVRNYVAVPLSFFLDMIEGKYGS